ncbi:RES domain-containing protein [Hankyongella ginsenosidimutans]|uniref:RES domain-containing protein n=1 Tax=Hankyongella ginsenosidimutans TaxID=1763828 RepID=A0A4D7C885_9SPHN|nr:RES family NAD+ phosphorylase [Hankyongella ginsenosidimutans]QCI78797.1 RES domain-containing protein [Hankyongella ginsenosidimutans]
MTLDKAILRELAVSIDVTGYLRIIDAGHRLTPVGMGFGKTRFSSPANAFKLLYVAQDLPTALAEAIIRDRFQAKQKRQLLQEDVEQSVIASMVARDPFKLLDLRTSGASQLGIPTDAARGRAQQAGRRFSQHLYDETDFDGIVYMSRITNAECVAIYDRAVGLGLDPTCPAVDLVRLADLEPALRSLNVSLVRKP